MSGQMCPRDRAVTAMYGFCHQRAPGFQDVSGGRWKKPCQKVQDSRGVWRQAQTGKVWVWMGTGMGLHRFWKPQQGLGQPGVLLGQMGTS